jgi:magnesium chelatase family protein
MGLQETTEICRVTEGADALLRTAMTRCGLSARAYHRVLRVAVTICDLAGMERVEPRQIAEALTWRQRLGAREVEGDDSPRSRQ